MGGGLSESAYDAARADIETGFQDKLQGYRTGPTYQMLSEDYSRELDASTGRASAGTPRGKYLAQLDTLYDSVTDKAQRTYKQYGGAPDLGINRDRAMIESQVRSGNINPIQLFDWTEGGGEAGTPELTALGRQQSAEFQEQLNLGQEGEQAWLTDVRAKAQAQTGSFEQYFEKTYGAIESPAAAGGDAVRRPGAGSAGPSYQPARGFGDRLRGLGDEEALEVGLGNEEPWMTA